MTILKSGFLCLACVTLSSCAGGHVADMPHWMGGLPADAPPRRGLSTMSLGEARSRSGEAED
jgi:hypothetical protein